MKIGKHPTLAVLADYAAGSLTKEEAEPISRHLDQCVFCRLEAHRLARFTTIDTDDELLVEADWSRARFELGKAYRETIAPAIAAVRRQQEDKQQARNDPPREDRKQQGWDQGRWLVPLAAAAVLLLIFINLYRGPGLESPNAWQDPPQPYRGEQQGEPAIALESPVGDLPACPESFSWRTDETFDAYTLEIYTPNLEVVFRQDKITAARFAVTDALRQRLAPGQTYLWSIQGQRGLRHATISANGWFKILPE